MLALAMFELIIGTVLLLIGRVGGTSKRSVFLRTYGQQELNCLRKR
jgi:uncharacterized membrane protein YdjX (TVP38/TMEM64 family)